MCPHLNHVIDEREGSIICLDCSFVISDHLFVADSSILYHDYNEITQYNKHHEFIKDTCDRMHIINSFTQKSIDCFEDFFKKLEPKQKVDGYIVAAYSIYDTLKRENVPRSLNMISYFTGISWKKLSNFEKKYQKKPNSTNVKQTLTTNYRHFNLTLSDLYNLIGISNSFKKTSFSPNTLAASLIYLYCKNNLIQCKLYAVVSTFQVTATAIYRCMKYIKNDDSLFNKLKKKD